MRDGSMAFLSELLLGRLSVFILENHILFSCFMAAIKSDVIWSTASPLVDGHCWGAQARVSVGESSSLPHSPLPLACWVCRLGDSPAKAFRVSHTQMCNPSQRFKLLRKIIIVVWFALLSLGASSSLVTIPLFSALWWQREGTG